MNRVKGKGETLAGTNDTDELVEDERRRTVISCELVSSMGVTLPGKRESQGHLWFKRRQTLPFVPTQGMVMFFPAEFLVQHVYWNNSEQQLEIDGEFDGTLTLGRDAALIATLKKYHAMGWVLTELPPCITDLPGNSKSRFEEYKRLPAKKGAMCDGEEV